MPSRATPGIEVKAIWFFARAWDFAPPAYKAQIEPQLEYWYKRYHGTLDGDAAIKSQIGAIEAQAQATLFPPADFTVAPAPTPENWRITPTPAAIRKLLGLEDKEYILANGSDADANGLWALLKGQQTPVPGIVIADPATVIEGHRDDGSFAPSRRNLWSSSRTRWLAAPFLRRPPSSRSRTRRTTFWPTA